MKEEIKDYMIISYNDAKNLYMILDTLDIFYKKHIKNSVEAINIVLHHFEIFSNRYNVPCGNLYVAEYVDNGVLEGYIAVCDGMSDNSNELIEKYGTDYSIEFEDYCNKVGLDLDYRID